MTDKLKVPKTMQPLFDTVSGLNVNGLAMDIRTAPLELQELAYQRGLIPFVPGSKRT